MHSEAPGAPPISVAPSNFENGAALTIGNATLQLTRRQTIDLIDALSRALAVKLDSKGPLPIAEKRRSPRAGEVRGRQR